MTRDETIQEIIEDLYNHCSDGGSFETFSAKTGIPPRKIKDWIRNSIEFQQAVEQACTLEMKFWEDKLRVALNAGLKESSIIKVCQDNLNRIRKTLERTMKIDLFKDDENKFSAIARTDSDLVKEFKEKSRHFSSRFNS